MNVRTTLLSLATACVGLACAGQALATANLGGVVSTGFVAGFGSCNKSKLVPQDTPQDTFVLSVGGTCDGGAAASGDLKAYANTATVGLRLSATGAASAAAQVRYFDQWLVHVAPGTLPGDYTIPVNFKIEGSVSPGSFARLGNQFLEYSFSARNIYGGSLPPTLYQANGNVTSTGAFLQTYSGNLNFHYYGPGSALPVTAEVEMILLAPQIENGTMDFFNTAAAGLVLPAGWSATSSSGLPLAFATAVPEPASGALLLLGLGGLGLLARKRTLAERG
jgi:hypothetical protein